MKTRKLKGKLSNGACMTITLKKTVVTVEANFKGRSAVVRMNRAKGWRDDFERFIARMLNNDEVVNKQRIGNQATA